MTDSPTKRINWQRTDTVEYESLEIDEPTCGWCGSTGEYVKCECGGIRVRYVYEGESKSGLE